MELIELVLTRRSRKHLGSDHFEPMSSWRTCSRCQQPFENREQAFLHFSSCPHPPQPQAHAPQTNPEDGFNETIETRLRSRKPHLKVEEWKPLYHLLFPDDEIIPEPGRYLWELLLTAANKKV
jgi:hypothetical protein